MPAQWDKVEDKYAVSSLAVAGVVALWGSTGLISVRFSKLPIFTLSSFSLVIVFVKRFLRDVDHL